MELSHCTDHKPAVQAVGASVSGSALAKFVTKSLRCMGCKARFREVTKCQHVSKGSSFARWKAIIKAGLLCEHCEKEKAADVESSCWQMDMQTAVIMVASLLKIRRCLYPLQSKVVIEQMENFRQKEEEYNRLWTNCQRCQGPVETRGNP